MKFVICLVIVALFSACGRESSNRVWWDNQKTIIELEQRLELARYRMEMTTTPEQSGISKLNNVPVEELREGIAAMNLRKRQLAAEIADMRDGWTAFQAETLQLRRSAATSEFFGDFNLPDGRLFRDARITKIEDGGVSISHETGAARLRIGDLDEIQRVYFGLDAELASIAHEKERYQRMIYERWHEERHAANEKDRRKLAEVLRYEESRLSNARLLAAANKTVAVRPLSSSIGALGETSKVSGSGYAYRRSRYYTRPTAHYYHYQPSAVRCFNGIPFWGSSAPYRGSCHSLAPPRATQLINPFSP